MKLFVLFYTKTDFNKLMLIALALHNEVSVR